MKVNTDESADCREVRTVLFARKPNNIPRTDEMRSLFFYFQLCQSKLEFYNSSVFMQQSFCSIASESGALQ
jgi:hypothetical protein